jgi:hypothetical protein
MTMDELAEKIKGMDADELSAYDGTIRLAQKFFAGVAITSMFLTMIFTGIFTIIITMYIVWHSANASTGLEEMRGLILARLEKLGVR